MLNTTIDKIVMILTSKILMVKPNNFRSNEETIVNNFFQRNSLGISNSVLNKIAIKEFHRFVKKLEEHKEIINKLLRDNKTEESWINETRIRLVRNIKNLQKKRDIIFRELES